MEKTPRKRFVFVVPDDMLAAMKRAAEARHMTLAAWVRAIILDALPKKRGGKHVAD